MEAPILPDQSLRAHVHCARAKGVAPSAALSIRTPQLAPALLAILRTGTIERLAHLLQLYLPCDNPDAKELVLYGQILDPENTAGARTATGVSGRWLHHFRGFTEQVRLRAVSACLGQKL